MIDHVTYQVPIEDIEDHSLEEFFDVLGFDEIDPEEAVPEGWDVRWFEDRETGEKVHVVASPEHDKWPVNWLSLAHLCVKVTTIRFEFCRMSTFLTRNNPDSDRIWLAHMGIRVEVRHS